MPQVGQKPPLHGVVLPGPPGHMVAAGRRPVVRHLERSKLAQGGWGPGVGQQPAWLSFAPREQVRAGQGATTFWVHTFEEVAADFKGAGRFCAPRKRSLENPPAVGRNMDMGDRRPSTLFQGPSWARESREEAGSGPRQCSAPGGGMSSPEAGWPGPSRSRAGGVRNPETTSKETLSCALPF